MPQKCKERKFSITCSESSATHHLPAFQGTQMWQSLFFWNMKVPESCSSSHHYSPPRKPERGCSFKTALSGQRTCTFLISSVLPGDRAGLGTWTKCLPLMGRVKHLQNLGFQFLLCYGFLSLCFFGAALLWVGQCKFLQRKENRA